MKLMESKASLRISMACLSIEYFAALGTAKGTILVVDTTFRAYDGLDTHIFSLLILVLPIPSFHATTGAFFWVLGTGSLYMDRHSDRRKCALLDGGIAA